MFSSVWDSLKSELVQAIYDDEDANAHRYVDNRPPETRGDDQVKDTAIVNDTKKEEAENKIPPPPVTSTLPPQKTIDITELEKKIAVFQSKITELESENSKLRETHQQTTPQPALTPCNAETLTKLHTLHALVQRWAAGYIQASRATPNSWHAAVVKSTPAVPPTAITTLATTAPATPAAPTSCEGLAKTVAQIETFLGVVPRLLDSAGRMYKLEVDTKPTSTSTTAATAGAPTSATENEASSQPDPALKQQQELVAKLRAALGQREAEVQRLTEAVAVATEREAQLLMELNQSTSALQKVEAQKSSLESQLASKDEVLRQTTDAMEMRLAEAKVKVVELEAKVAELEVKAETKGGKLPLEAIIAMSEAEKKQKVAELQLKEAQSEVASLKDDFSTALEAETAALKGEVRRLTAQTEEMQAALDEVGAELVRVKAQAQEEAVRAARAAKEGEGAKAAMGEKAALVEEVSRLKQVNVEGTRVIKELQDQVAGLSKVVDERDAAANETRVALSRLSAALEDARLEGDRKLQDLQVVHGKALRDLAQTRKDLVALQEGAAGAGSALEQERDGLKVRVGELEGVVAGLRVDLEAAVGEVSRLMASNAGDTAGKPAAAVAAGGVDEEWLIDKRVVLQVLRAYLKAERDVQGGVLGGGSAGRKRQGEVLTILGDLVGLDPEEAAVMLLGEGEQTGQGGGLADQFVNFLQS